MQSLYEVLGVAKDATTAQIKKAYRRAAQKVHPDREDGDAEKFHQVQLAYEVLSDDERRNQYDETGDTGQKASGGLSSAEQEVVKIFDSLIEQDFEGDMIKEAKKLVNQGRARGQEEKGIVRRKLAKYKKQRKRVTTEAEEDLFTMVLDSKIQQCDSKLESIEAALKLADQIEDILDQYTDQKPEEPEQAVSSTGVNYGDLLKMMRQAQEDMNGRPHSERFKF